MLRNLKHSILFILIALTILLVVFVSLAASRPVSIDTATVYAQKENNLASGKWSGLGINVSATSDNLWQLSDFFGDQIDDLLANGFTDIRVDLANWASDPAIERSKASVNIAVAKGANVIWGVSSGAVTLTAANWADYSTKVLELAAWAQDNGVYEFQIGNEEEEHNDNATLTDAQLRANLRTLATNVQAVFTRGKVSYACVGDVPKIAPWIAEGKGDTDLLAFNSYQGGVVFGDSWKTVITNMVNAFGVDGTYISEFSLSGTSLASWSADEAVQAADLDSMLNFIKSAGIERALYFAYYDDPRPWNPEGFGVLKTDRTYKLLWNTLTSDTSIPDITLSPASKDFSSVDIISLTNPDQVFTIQNTGSANLIIGTIAITGTDASQFAKPDDTASGQTIAAGTSKTLTVTFDPTTTGEKTAILSIPSNDPDTPTLTADLTGTGSNNIITGSIVLTETGLSSGVSAGFTLYDNNNQAIGSENIVTGPESPTVTWTNVPYGSDYKIVETTVPAGYIKMPDITNISITTQGQTVNITVNADVERTAPNITGLSNDTTPTESNEASSSSLGLSSSKGIQQYEDPVKAFVARFYQECLSRDPDNGGLNGWADDLASGAKTGAKVAYGFIFNDEFKQKNVSNEEYITILYRAFFNREPDSGGFNNWLRHLNNGKSRKWVLAGFIKSKEFKNLCAAYGIKPGSI